MRILSIALIAVLFLTSCQRNDEVPSLVSVSGSTMGTLYRVKIATPELSPQDIQSLARLIQSTLDAINQEMNHYNPDSEISRFNAWEKGSAFEIGDDFYEVVKRSFEIYDATEGAFDITIAPIVNLWGFGPEDVARETPPSALEIKKALSQSGQDQLVLSPSKTLLKKTSGLTLDVSAIAKGYAVDAVSQALKANGYQNFMVEIGGEVFVAGHTLEAKPWTIGVQSPQTQVGFENTLHRKLLLTNLALATSGNYQNYLDLEGKHYSHILDPRTGYPTPTSIVSASVIAPECSIADAAATAVTVLGLENGLAWIESEPELEAMLLIQTEDNELQEVLSSGFKKYITN